MMKRETFAIANIYVPVKRRATLDPKKAQAIAESMLQVALHSQYHRGQINARLRALGGEPPRVDYIIWLWLGRPPADWSFISGQEK